MRREDSLNSIEIIDILPGNYEDVFESLRRTRPDISEKSLKRRLRYHLNALFHSGYVKLVYVKDRGKRLYFLTDRGEQYYDKVRKNLIR